MLGVEHALRVRRVRRGPIAARYVEVLAPGARVRRGHARGGGHAHPHAHGRSYREIRRLLERARLDPAVRRRALAIFEALGRAEARVHGIALEKVHFHEVGAVDAIVDVTGAAIGLERLGVARVTASPVALGSGSVDSEHGRLPLPAPATLELLRGVPTVPAHVRWETVTPTGAAILRTVVDAFGELPAMTVESIGHGAGNDRAGELPNVLRAVLGRGAGVHADRIAVLETNLDDFVPEHFDYLMERLFAAGALDVSSLSAAWLLTAEGLSLDRRARRASLDGETVDLTPKALAVLGYLMTHPDEAISRERLLEAVWGWEYPAGTRTVETRMAELRRALDDNPAEPRFIETISGEGYRFIAKVEAEG